MQACVFIKEATFKSVFILHSCAL